MAFVDGGGFKLHYELEGDSAKPTVLLSNSLGADLSMWDAQMDALLEDFRVLRYNTRGHGKSSMPARPCRLADLGQDAITLLDELKIQGAHVCGVSLGGLTAMWIGLHVPQRVRSLVLSNTAAKIGTADGWNERIANVENQGLASITDGVLSRWFTPGFSQSADALTRQKTMFLGCSVAGYVAAGAAIRDSDLRAEISNLLAPTLVISGANDVVTPASDGRAIAAAVPDAVFRLVPGAHLSNIEEPLAYNEALLSFLKQNHSEATYEG